MNTETHSAEEYREVLTKVCNAVKDQRLKSWIPRYLLTLLEQGNNVQDETEEAGFRAQLAQILPGYCVPHKFETEEQRHLSEGSERQDDWRSILFELSPVAENFWADQYRNFLNPNGKYQTLLGFVSMREKYLHVSHESSVELLYRAGWKPIDTMCAYLLSMTTNRIYDLSPDAVRAAVKMDPEAAVRLLDKKMLGEAIIGHHPSYQAYWQKIWMEMLYLFCDFEDRAFLYREHKARKLKQQCETICKRLDCPGYEQEQLEQELDHLFDALDKKTEKKQKRAVLHAFVCNYQWSSSDWLKMKDTPGGRKMAGNLLWGCYKNGELRKTFAVRGDGQLVDANGNAAFSENFCGQQELIGLVHPEELTEAELKSWSKYARKAKWRQPFPQLKISVCRGTYDLTAFSGRQVKQLYFITAAGKWGLYQGSDKNKYSSYHMADQLHGYGAQLTFDGAWRGPEYGPETITVERVVFYRFRHFLLWEHVPESLVCAPEELPPRFVSTALAAFRGIIGSGKVEE